MEAPINIMRMPRNMKDTSITNITTTNHTMGMRIMITKPMITKGTIMRVITTIMNRRRPMEPAMI